LVQTINALIAVSVNHRRMHRRCRQPLTNSSPLPFDIAIWRTLLLSPATITALIVVATFHRPHVIICWRVYSRFGGTCNNFDLELMICIVQHPLEVYDIVLSLYSLQRNVSTRAKQIISIISAFWALRRDLYQFVQIHRRKKNKKETRMREERKQQWEPSCTVFQRCGHFKYSGEAFECNIT
jgi:hypothetical protein